MALTMDERKERYYKLVLEKANEIYASWQTNGIKSKRIVEQANVYAFDKRLKLDAGYRFYILAFTVALGIRLERRYGTFFRRLFFVFAYLRERAALRTLKRVFGFHSDTDIREMISLEAEKITIPLFNREKEDSMDGGKRAKMGDITIEEELNSFLKEGVQEEEPKATESNLDADEVEKLEAHDETFLSKTEETQREKICVEEFERVELLDGKKKEIVSLTKTERLETQTTNPLETSISDNIQSEKSIEKTVASTSILAETIMLGEERKENLPSPFPIFRENSKGNATIRGKENFVSSKQNNETKASSAREEGERLDKNIHIDRNQEKNPFPVFGKEQSATVKVPEKTVEKEVKVSNDIKVGKDIKANYDIEVSNDIKASNDIHATTESKSQHEMTMHAMSNISEENKARVALNTTMSEREIQAIVEQVKAAANMEMKEEEQAWREQIAVENNSNDLKVGLQEHVNSSNKSAIAPGIKK